MGIEKIIKISHLDKIYRLYDEPMDRLKEGFSIFKKKKFHQEFYALQDINFTIEKGETIGIIGRNGAGKSTLLKIITGVLTKTSGEVSINGRISALLELGAGFNTEYTGIENIYLQGTLMGFTKSEMELKVDDILEFADIGEFIHQPVRTYSSGMFVRLAFAIAINVDPEILIIDEALAVGDIRFQQKCYRKIEEFKKEKTVILVTHDMGSIVKFCSRVLWLDNGQLKAYEEPQSIVKKYRAFMVGEEMKDLQEVDAVDESDNDASSDDSLMVDITDKFEIFGDKLASVEKVGIFSCEKADASGVFENADKIKVVIKGKVKQDNYDYIVGFTINDRHGNLITQTNTFVQDSKVEVVNKCYKVEFVFKIPFLNEGIYTISPAIASGTQNEHVQHCWVYDALEFRVINTSHDKLEGFITLSNVEIN